MLESQDFIFALLNVMILSLTIGYMIGMEDASRIYQASQDSDYDQ